VTRKVNKIAAHADGIFPHHHLRSHQISGGHLHGQSLRGRLAQSHAGLVDKPETSCSAGGCGHGSRREPDGLQTGSYAIFGGVQDQPVAALDSEDPEERLQRHKVGCHQAIPV